MMQLADILLFRVGPKSTLLDRLIGWGQRVIHQAPTKLEYCHVAMIGPDPDSLFEARWPRIHNILLDMPDLQLHNPVEVYRLKGITQQQVNTVLEYAKHREGEWYNLTAILTFGAIQLGHSAVCSQYVWECFTAAGVCLCPYEDLESPDDIAGSDKLERVL